jgi:hypothetical protein
MPTCKYCGNEIEFRYIDGQSTPIHINGGWCSGVSGPPPQGSTKPFGAVQSYVNPNAHCPVCGEIVFFYQSPYGGRVYFDDLGWPWPKHPCTDNPRSQTGRVSQAKSLSRRPFFLSRAGQALHLYRIVELSERRDSISVKFSRIDQPLMAFRLSISLALLANSDVTTKDLKNAPAFVIRFHDDHRLLEFISGRKQKIESLQVPRDRPRRT